ncbi:MAG: malto-oligosyltrehalose synthase [bacterium]
MIIPKATYRVQFNYQFTFAQAKKIVPYLKLLGISHIYASPIFKARKKSMHGYDIVDLSALNPELGIPDFDMLTEELRNHGISWIQDIVPNHMACDSENTMLMNILEYGEQSPYYRFFDIDWNHPYENMHGRVLIPCLGKFYAECLEQGEISLRYEHESLSINYYEMHLPVKIESYHRVFEHAVPKLEEKIGKNHPLVLQYIGAVNLFKALETNGEMHNRFEHVAHAKHMLWKISQNDEHIRTCVDEMLTEYNGEKGIAHSFDLLDELIARQRFRLSFWKVATEEINYRRFFTVNDLISVRVEDRPVVEKTHAYIKQLVSTGKIQGLRIDHIDGLYDPAEYLAYLHEQFPDTYIIVEKILDLREDLSVRWPVQGTTGYDFLNFVNELFCCRQNNEKCTVIYTDFSSIHKSYEEILVEKKRLIIGKHMAGNIDNLAQYIKKISSKDRHGNDITLYGLRRGLVEVMTHFSVYRTYIRGKNFSKIDRMYIRKAIEKAREESYGLFHEIDFIENLLLLQYDDSLPEADKELWLHFVKIFQQQTGPLMAKGLEDTLFYLYNRLISLNEVGGDPARFGITVKDFHNFNKKRRELFPHTLNATATHDTKRGEDMRARINVLSELPDEWEQKIRHWQVLNKDKKKKIKNTAVPDANDEYFFYQTLIGSLPFVEEQGYVERIKQYVIKAVREAKVHTAWIKPDQAYEEAYLAFVDAVLHEDEHNNFLQDLKKFQQIAAWYGIHNSLSQALIKMTVPGVPDFYQGCELWDFSLVDPDNRCRIDYALRTSYLEEIIKKEQDIPLLIDELYQQYADGRIKLYLIYKTLALRNSNPELFQKGSYIPIDVEGLHKDSITAYMRRYEQSSILIIAPRLLNSIIKPNEKPLQDVWQDTRLLLLPEAPSAWINTITGQYLASSSNGIMIAEALSLFPVCILKNKI